MRKKVIIPTIALLAILGAVSVGTINVSAQSPVYDRLVSQIAQRFNLKESDVEDVVNQVRETHKAEMKKVLENDLSVLVSSGKIIESQKQLLIKKHEEVQKKMNELKGLPLDERRANMKVIRGELKKWASDNNLDIKSIPMLGHGPRSLKGLNDN